jgi:hypothetical protein
VSFYRKGLAAPNPNTLPFRDDIKEKKAEIEANVDTVFLARDAIKVVRMVRTAFKKRP